MGNRLFIGNLSYQLSTEELRTEFGKFGTVNDAKVMTDRETGRSRGFGFVTMSSDAEAASAIQGLNGIMLAGRAINVNEAQERSQGPRRFSAPGGGGGGYAASGGGFDGPPPDRGGAGGGDRGRNRGSRRKRDDRGGGYED